MKRITTYISGKNKYHIFKDENGFWGFKDEWIDEEGKLKFEINGVNGLLSDTLKECLERIENICIYDKLLKDGYSDDEIENYFVLKITNN